MSLKKPSMTPAEFRRLPKSEKAMLVAHDVIQQIKLQNLNVLRGSYINANRHAYDMAPDASAKENICEIGKACTVCAKGALFLGTIGRVNNATVDDVINADESIMVERMEKERIFSRANLDLIECAFEKSLIMGFGVTDKQVTEAIEFGEDHKTSPDRLVAIMLNVLDHNGKFVPKDRISAGRVNAALRVRTK